MYLIRDTDTKAADLKIECFWNTAAVKNFCRVGVVKEQILEVSNLIGVNYIVGIIFNNS